MLKRILLLLVALVLLLGAAAGLSWFLNARKGETTTGSGTAENGDGLPASGEPAVSPASEPSSAETLSLVCPERWKDLPDSDQDGLPDQVEALYRTDAASADTDGDGFSDSVEVRAGYDPAKKEGNPRLDSDGDGLLDSDECRWKTDPFKTDTDGDGFEDGAEVTNKFDPTSKGDGQGSDALPERRARVAQAALERFRPNATSENLTERLAAELFGDRPSTDLGTFTPTPEDIQRTLDRSPRNVKLPSVALSELTVQSRNTPSEVASYLSAVKIKEPFPVDAASLYGAMNAALQGNTGELAAIRGTLETYEQALLTTPTPASAMTYHRTLIGFIRFTTERFRAIEEASAADPARAYLAFRELEEGSRTHTGTLVSLRDELGAIARSP